MATYIRLTDYKSSDVKEQEFFNPENRYEASQNDFVKIPGSPIAYWVSSKVNQIFLTSDKLKDMYSSGGRIKTHNNELYVRNVWEVEKDKIEYSQVWKLYENGGESLKWYGNKSYVVNWTNTALEEYKSHGGLTDSKYWNKTGITWSIISTNKTSFRFKSNDSEFSSGSPTIFIEDDNKLVYTISVLNSNIYQDILKITAPTVNTSVGDVLKLPIKFPKRDSIKQQINQLTQQNIDISKQEWDSRETSWDFTKNELLKHKQDGSLENALISYSTYWSEQFNTLHSNEEELNRLFIDIYGLQDELTPDIALEDITILKSEKKIVNGKLDFQNSDIIKQFISYAVGCMFGRYTLNQDGLVVANQDQEIPTNTTYEIDDDNIIPIVDESDYFSDDMTDRFTEFVRTTFGSEKLQQNIAFIETSIGKKLRAYFQKDFYIDHTKRYKKRPIYWLFTSPKGMFKVLIYMHRYTPDTLNNILNDYLRPFRIRLDSMREESMRITESESSSSRDKTDADKKIDKIDKTLDDINEYEKTLAHYAAMRIEIDLDDGVKVNYCKFKELLFEYDKKLCK